MQIWFNFCIQLCLLPRLCDGCVSIYMLFLPNTFWRVVTSTYMLTWIPVRPLSWKYSSVQLFCTNLFLVRSWFIDSLLTPFQGRTRIQLPNIPIAASKHWMRKMLFFPNNVLFKLSSVHLNESCFFSDNNLTCQAIF